MKKLFIQWLILVIYASIMVYVSRNMARRGVEKEAVAKGHATYVEGEFTWKGHMLRRKHMIAKELIELLEKVPPDTRCHIEGDIGGIPIRESVASTSPCEKMVKKRWPDAVVKRFVDYYRVNVV